MKKMMYLLLAALMLATVPAEAQSLKKMQKQMEKQQAIEKMRQEYEQQRKVDSLKREREMRELQAELNKDYKVDVPCMQYSVAPAGIIRSNVSEGTGLSSDLGTAAAEARTYAVNSLATKIAVNTASLTETHRKEIRENGGVYNKKEFQDGVAAFVKQEIHNIHTVCEEVRQTPDGDYRVWVVVEVKTEELNSLHKKLTNDQMLRADFDFEQFQAKLQAKISEYEQQNK